MRTALLTAILCMAAVPALAQHVEIRGKCHAAEPVEGVAPAEYQGGRDVNGNPVVPADLNKKVKAIQYPLQIPVEIDTLRLLGLDLSDEGLGGATEMKATPATLTVYEDGRIEYNGADISDRATYVCDDEEKTEETAAPAQPEAKPVAAPEAAPKGEPAPAAEPAPVKEPEKKTDDAPAAE